ncbi:MAG: two-component system sensor histidine kinase NtrB [Nitrospiraceae bacterium]
MSRQKQVILWGFIAAFTIGTFLLDLAMPLGYIIWLIYLIPLLLASLLPQRHLPLWLVFGLGLVLTEAGVLYAPEERSIFSLALFNRTLGFTILGLATVFLLHYRKLQDDLRATEEQYQLRLERESRRQTEEALREAQERFHSIFTSSKDAIAYVGLNGAIEDMNQAFTTLTGYPHQELLGKTARDLVPVEDEAYQEKALQTLITSGKPIEYETEYLRADGSCVPVALTGFLVRQHNQIPRAMAFIVKDITERKQAEKALHAVAAELEEKNRALARTNDLLSAARREAARVQRLSAMGQFAATVAHKIGTPLTALSGHVQLLLEDSSLSQKAHERLQTVQDQIERTSRIIQELLYYVRRPDPVLSLLDLNSCLTECITLFQPEFDRRGVRCHTDFRLTSQKIHGNAQQLQEVFSHLFENAAQAMPQGGALNIYTCVQSAEDSPQVAVHIQDSGCGIDREHVAQIFQPFFTTKSKHGTGLGLAIVLDTIQRHRGSISVESEPGKGTRFVILFPLVEESIHDSASARTHRR